MAVVVNDRDLVGSDDFEGCCEISMDILKDQLKHDLWLELFDFQGRKMQGTLHIVLQWIHSNVFFYADLLKRWEIRISEELRIKEEIDQVLAEMRGI